MPPDDKEAVEFILLGLNLDRNSYRLGLSQVFLRAGHLGTLDRQVELQTQGTMVLFQAYCRGWLGRKKREDLELFHSAVHVIQRNIRQANIIKEWRWWKLLLKVHTHWSCDPQFKYSCPQVKPLLAVWKAEVVVKERDVSV